MRALARHGFTPTATARILVALNGLDVSSLEAFARHVKHHDAALQGAQYSVGAFNVGDGRRGVNKHWRHGRALLDAYRLGIAS
jgi:hypothetical protein